MDILRRIGMCLLDCRSSEQNGKSINSKPRSQQQLIIIEASRSQSTLLVSIQTLGHLPI
jgi:hypothetical protein